MSFPTEPPSVAVSVTPPYGTEEDVEEDALKSIWDDDHIEKSGTKDGQKWKCLWCETTFKGWNATKALCHVARQSGKDITPCVADIAEASLERYRTLLKSKQNKKCAQNNAVHSSHVTVDPSSNTQFITTLSDNDVLLGRGTGPSEFPGNQKFLQLVRQHKDEYNSSYLRTQKAVIARRVVDIVHNNGGRFLKKVEPVVAEQRGFQSDGKGVWYEETYETALEKAKQALREKSLSVSKQSKHETWEEKTESFPPQNSSLTSSVAPLQAGSLMLGGTFPATLPLPPVPVTSAGTSFQFHPPSQQPHVAFTGYNASLLHHHHGGQGAQNVTTAPTAPAFQRQAQTVSLTYHVPAAKLAKEQQACLPGGSLHPSVVGAAPTFQQAPPPNPLKELRVWAGSWAHEAAGVFGLTTPNNTIQKQLPREKRQLQEENLAEATRPSTRFDPSSIGPPAATGNHAHFCRPFTGPSIQPCSVVEQASPRNEEERAAADFLLDTFVQTEDADAPRFTEEFTQRERELLTAEERVAALTDVFGDLCEISPSTKRVKRSSESETLECLLQAMRREIHHLPVEKKSALLEAQKKACTKEFSDERLELFLRREDMNAERAALRVALYWEKRREWFGPDRFCLPMTQDGVFRDDQAALQTGFVGLLPDLDASGRHIVYFLPRNHTWDGYTSESMVRAIWYVFEAASEHPNAAKGVVQLGWDKGSTIWDYDRKVEKEMIQLERDVWPVHFVSTHVCCLPSFLTRWILPLVFAQMDKRTRSRTVLHDCPESEIVQVLASYGMPAEVLPKEMGGKSEHNHSEWLAKRRAEGK